MSDKKKIVSASPKVRKLAREFGANIYQIEGSQRKGRVSEEDVKSYIKESISEKSIKKKPQYQKNMIIQNLVKLIFSQFLELKKLLVHT